MLEGAGRDPPPAGCVDGPWVPGAGRVAWGGVLGAGRVCGGVVGAGRPPADGVPGVGRGAPVFPGAAGFQVLLSRCCQFPSFVWRMTFPFLSAYTLLGMGRAAPGRTEFPGVTGLVATTARALAGRW